MNGGMRLEQLPPAPQHADPGGSEHLVGTEGQEVTSEGAHVGGNVGYGLGAVGQHHGTGAMGSFGDPGEGCDGPENVRHGRTGHELYPVEESIEVGQVEAVVLVDGDPTELDAALFGQHQPRHDVGVVFHLGEEHAVAGAEIRPGPGGSDQVDGLRGVLGEDHLVLGVGRADQPSYRHPGRFVEAVRFLGDRVDPTVHVGVGGLVVRVHGVEDTLGALRRRGRVEIDDAVPVHGPTEQRKIIFELGKVDTGRARLSAHRRRGVLDTRIRHGHLRHGS